MLMASSLILPWLFVFLEISAKTTGQSVFLQCNEKIYQTEYGQNQTINCMLDWSNHGSDCKAKDNIECECDTEQYDCELKTTNVSSVSKTRQETVEIYRITVTGNYSIFMRTTCGHDVADSITITVIPAFSSTPGSIIDPPKTTSLVMGSVSAALALMVILGIWKHRKDKMTKERHRIDCHEPLQHI